ncbi:MAG: hypothetical protein E2592_05855 [Methylobacillus sp.]|nr:hypothetical protein [Methylobacillus sp.]
MRVLRICDQHCSHHTGAKSATCDWVQRV